MEGFSGCDLHVRARSKFPPCPPVSPVGSISMTQVLLGCYVSWQIELKMNKERQREARTHRGISTAAEGDCRSYQGVQQFPLIQSRLRHQCLLSSTLSSIPLVNQSTPLSWAENLRK